jgi:hypothetical protein
MTDKIKLEDKTQEDNEIDYKEIGIDRVSDDIYKYTNKGKVHEFDLSLLTPQERKKFDKLSNKEKQRLIATVELQQMPSMFDEISLKSVVYPDPDSNITDIQAAAAKYNDLQKLIDSDASFKHMEFGYLKYGDIQKYIIKYCPNINQYDIDLLLKLKPDITVNQFMNYFKNIMNDKNLVELNKIQKQLKNPYSDELLKKILNNNEQYSAKLLNLIVNNNFSKLEEIDKRINDVLNKAIETNQDIEDYIGVRKGEVIEKLSEYEKKLLRNGRSLIADIRRDVNKLSAEIEPALKSLGLKINDKNEIKNILYDKSTYDELRKLINEKVWDGIVAKFGPTIGNDVSSDEFKNRMKERRRKDKEEISEEEEEKEEPTIRDTQTEPLTTTEVEEEEIETNTSNINEPPFIKPASFDPLTIPDIMPEIIPFTSKKDEVNSLKYKLNDLISNRIKELETEYSNLEDYSRVYGEIPDDKKGLGIIRRDGRETTTYEHSAAEYVRIYNLLKKGIRIRLFKDMNTNKKHKQYKSLGEEFATDEMIELAKKIDGLGGSIFSRIKNTFRAPDEIKETKMKLSELSEKTVENNKSLRELEKTIEELTNRVNELSKQVGKSYVDRKMSKPSFLNDITKPQNLKPVEKPKEKPVVPQENPDSMEAQMKRKMEERRKDIEPDYSEESEEEWGEGVGGKIKIESSDAKKPIPMSDFFKKYL